MMTPRENYMIALYGGKPQWVPDFWEDVNMLSFNKYDLHPIENGLMEDFFGISYMGNMPSKLKFWDDISDWRKYPFPDLSKIDWEAEREFYKQIIDPTKLVRMDFGGHGLFLTICNALGFTDGLCSLIEEEEEVLAFLRAYTDYIKDCIRYAVKYIDLDMVSICEDTSNARGPFISKEYFRKFFRPFVQEICDLAHYYNCAFNVHNCGNPQYLLDEYLDMGVNGVDSCNYSEYLVDFHKRSGGRLCIQGGWDSQGAPGIENAPREVVIKSVHDCYDRYAANGAYVTEGNAIVPGGDVKAMKDKVNLLQEEANKIRFEYYGPKAPEILEQLSKYTHGMDGMWKIMQVE